MASEMAKTAVALNNNSRCHSSASNSNGNNLVVHNNNNNIVSLLMNGTLPNRFTTTTAVADTSVFTTTSAIPKNNNNNDNEKRIKMLMCEPLPKANEDFTTTTTTSIATNNNKNNKLLSAHEIQQIRQEFDNVALTTTTATTTTKAQPSVTNNYNGTTTTTALGTKRKLVSQESNDNKKQRIQQGGKDQKQLVSMIKQVQQRTDQVKQEAKQQKQRIEELQQESKRQRVERFLMFVRVLLKYLEQKDPPMHARAKEIIRQCAEKNKNKEKGYESVTASMQKELKETVGDIYWKRAESYLKHFLKQKMENEQRKAAQEAKKEEDEPKKSNNKNYEKRAANFVTDLLSLYATLTSSSSESNPSDGSSTTPASPSSQNLKFNTVGNRKEMLQLTERFMEQHELMVRQHAQQQQQTSKRQKREKNDDNCSFTDTRVLIGYHVTKSTNLPSIGQRGLLSGNERQELNVKSHQGFTAGTYFGHGVYLANNPRAFSSNSDTCIMVAMVQGATKYVGRKLPASLSSTLKQTTTTAQQQTTAISATTQNQSVLDAIVGNKRADNVSPRRRRRNNENSQNTSFTDEIVLQKSNQSLALIQATCAQFRGNIATALEKRASFDLMWTFHVELQKLMDKHFNNHNFFQDGSKGFSHVTYPSSSSDFTPIVAGTSSSCVHLVKPLFQITPKNESLKFNADSNNNHALKKSFETTLLHSYCLTDKCPICQDLFSQKGRGPVVCLKICRHEFHQRCLQQSIKNGRQLNCPTCQCKLWEPRGKSPSGTMTISHNSAIVASSYSTTRTTNSNGSRGASSSSSSSAVANVPKIQGLQYTTLNSNNGTNESDMNGSIQITYNMLAGVQTQHHPNPGVSYPRTCRHAYLPNNKEGRELLKRLKCAFRHGLTFLIGRSMTTGRDNQIVWSSIPHKTTLARGAPFGYPDADYFRNCHEELNKLGVPPVDEL